MAKQRQQRERRRSQIGSLEELDPDRLRLKTSWSPFPAWIVPAVGAAVVAALVVAIQDGDAGGGAALGALGGYAAGAVLWAVGGAMGGDKLEVTFDLQSDEAHVFQSLFWAWRREWSFSLDDADSVEIRERRGRLFLKFSATYSIALRRYEQEALRLGKYPTEGEAVEVAKPLATFLDIPLRQPRRAKSRR
ncbi:MAG: hypothetical protein V3V06_00580 [Dehalococcoidia bacterium]